MYFCDFSVLPCLWRISGNKIYYVAHRSAVVSALCAGIPVSDLLGQIPRTSKRRWPRSKAVYVAALVLVPA